MPKFELLAILIRVDPWTFAEDFTGHDQARAASDQTHAPLEYKAAYHGSVGESSGSC